MSQLLFGTPGYNVKPSNRSLARRSMLHAPGPLSILRMTCLPFTSWASGYLDAKEQCYSANLPQTLHRVHTTFAVDTNSCRKDSLFVLPLFCYQRAFWHWCLHIGRFHCVAISPHLHLERPMFCFFFWVSTAKHRFGNADVRMLDMEGCGLFYTFITGILVPWHVGNGSFNAVSRIWLSYVDEQDV